MRRVTAKTTLCINIGQSIEKEVFTKGKSYRYWDGDSVSNHHKIEPNSGCGMDLMFNDERFYKYFT